MQQYKSLDMFKIIAAILVVAIHTQLLCGTEAGYYIRCLCRIAVPFFFVCSSYLFWSKHGSIKKYTKRILLLYFVWLILSLPYVVNSFFMNSNSAAYNVAQFVRGLLFHNTFHASWYLMSSVIAMNLVYWLSKRLSNKILQTIGMALYLFSLLSCSYHGVTDKIGINTWYPFFEQLFVPSNSFFVAFIYIVIGKLIAEKDSVSSLKKSIILSAQFLILGGGRNIFCKGMDQVYRCFCFLTIFYILLFPVPVEY